VLPDGTNEEGEDIKEPLGLTRDDLEKVVLYGQDASPPCVKIQTMLDYYGVPFEMVKGRHPTSDYKKIPVIELNDRQVNDSHVIVRNLVPVLTGRALTEEELEWERRITFEFQPSFEVELFGNGGDLAKFVGAEGWQAGLLGLASGPLSALVGSVFRSRYGDFPAAAAWGRDFQQALGDRPFYHGEAPGPVDLSLYGTYVRFEEKGCQTSADFLGDSGLRAWHERMAQATKAGTLAEVAA
jgi:glutathione S-transferase